MKGIWDLEVFKTYKTCLDAAPLIDVYEEVFKGDVLMINLIDYSKMEKPTPITDWQSFKVVDIQDDTLILEQFSQKLASIPFFRKG